MAVLGDVFGSLQRMTLLQLLFGFLACTGYALAQGSLFEMRAKAIAGAVSALSALGFVVEANQWVYGFMLLAFAVAGMGMLTGAVWLMSRALGFSGAETLRPVDSSFLDSSAIDPASVETSPVEVAAAPARGVAAPGLPAHSH